MRVFLYLKAVDETCAQVLHALGGKPRFVDMRKIVLNSSTGIQQLFQEAELIANSLLNFNFLNLSTDLLLM